MEWSRCCKTDLFPAFKLKLLCLINVEDLYASNRWICFQPSVVIDLPFSTFVILYGDRTVHCVNSNRCEGIEQLITKTILIYHCFVQQQWKNLYPSHACVLGRNVTSCSICVNDRDCKFVSSKCFSTNSGIFQYTFWKSFVLAFNWWSTKPTSTFPFGVLIPSGILLSTFILLFFIPCLFKKRTVLRVRQGA